VVVFLLSAAVDLDVFLFDSEGEEDLDLDRGMSYSVDLVLFLDDSSFVVWAYDWFVLLLVGIVDAVLLSGDRGVEDYIDHIGTYPERLWHRRSPHRRRVAILNIFRRI
jgi:hypothetical protein